MNIQTEVKAKRNVVSGKITLERLCKIMGVMTPDDYTDKWDGTCYCGADGESFDCNCVGEMYSKYLSALESVSEDLFNEHGLTLTRNKNYEYTVTPSNKENGWQIAAQHIMNTVNGYGPFWFSSVKEFTEVNSGTTRSAVLCHLGYIKHYPAVYGGRSVMDRIYNHMK